MIRYTFDTVQQLSRHLRQVDNTVLLFVRNATAATKGTKVLLELQIRAGAERTVVRSEVVARSGGSSPGAWLQLSDPRLAERLRDPDALLGRRDRRICVDQPVLLQRDEGQQMAQMLDVSAGGLRVKGGGGLRLGDLVLVQLVGARRFDSTLGAARVERLDRGGAGLRFVQGTPAALAYLKGLEEAWAKADAVEHQAGCCAGGGLAEPMPPRLSRGI